MPSERSVRARAVAMLVAFATIFVVLFFRQTNAARSAVNENTDV